MTARRTSSLLILLSALSAPVFGVELRQITLRDGSVIIGEIESVHNGTYSVRSPSLGTITLEESTIQKIEASGAAPDQPESTAAQSSATSDSQIEALRNRIVSDDAVSNFVTALQNDPQVQEVLEDPVIIDAIRAGNTDALQGNRKIQRLIDNPAVQELTRKLTQ